jgi:serine carboxypeptidase-like clade 2
MLPKTKMLLVQINVHSKRPKEFKMLVFSGDVDGVCATVGTQDWIYSVIQPEMNYTNSTADFWRPWFVSNGQLGGFLTLFSSNFAFATVRGAGHEVCLIIWDVENLL